MNPIRKARLLAEMTQLQLAEAVGVSPGAISQWETGRTYPSGRTLIKLSSILNTTADELLKDEKRAM